MSGTSDDSKRLNDHELGIEMNKYCDAINELAYCGEYDLVRFNDIFGCIIGEVMDLDHETPSDEGIEKGELHKRDRMRFASGVFKAFFDEKIIDEEQYDRLFRNLRVNIPKDCLGWDKEQKRLLEDFLKLRREKMRIGGAELRSERVLPPNDL